MRHIVSDVVVRQPEPFAFVAPTREIVAGRPICGNAVADRNRAAECDKSGVRVLNAGEPSAHNKAEPDLDVASLSVTDEVEVARELPVCLFHGNLPGQRVLGNAIDNSFVAVLALVNRSIGELAFALEKSARAFFRSQHRLGLKSTVGSSKWLMFIFGGVMQY